MALFSIVTVTRNNLAGLQRTHQSLQQQPLQGFEWLVIDGASTDGTVEYLNSLSPRGEGWGEGDIKWLSEPDTGLYDAMNKGIERSTGFFLLFLNAGDALAAETTIEEIAAYIHELQETPDFIYGDSLEERPGHPPAHKPARPYKNSAYGMFTHHQAMLYRRDLIGDLRYDAGYKIAADYKFTLQYLARAKTIVYCPFPLCLFECGGLSQQKAALGRREQMDIRKELRAVSPLQNRFIALRQKIVWTLRRTFPNLYWLIKEKLH